LGSIKPLGADLWPQVSQAIDEILDNSDAFTPTKLDRSEVEREVRRDPQPRNCSLTLHNGTEWRAKADAALDKGCQQLQEYLLEKVRPLQSVALRDRLQQGTGEPLLDKLLATSTIEATVAFLVQTIGDEGTTTIIDLLNRYLRKLSVRKVHLADFNPSRHTIEPHDIDAVVAEFRTFLQSALQPQGDESPVIELK
jgi:hypothetical protein